jgi:prepilin-type N-terminal cleavage/methylation domain-containing protein
MKLRGPQKVEACGGSGVFTALAPPPQVGGMRLRRAPGFTLIELLVVTLLMGLVITAIGACLGGGLRVWDAAQRFGTAESDGLVALETMCRDLRSTFTFAAIPFQCSETELTLAGLVHDPESGRVGLGTIHYRCDGARRVLIREIGFYDDELKQVHRESLAGHVVDLRFLVKPSESATQGGSTNLIPVRVDVALSLQSDDESPVEELTRSMSIVAGGLP